MTTHEPPADNPLGIDPDRPIPITLLMPHPIAPHHMFNVVVVVPARVFTQVLMTPQLEADLNQYVESMDQAAEALIQLAQTALATAKAAQTAQTNGAGPVILKAHPKGGVNDG